MADLTHALHTRSDWISDVCGDIEQHADTILQVCSYHRLDFDLVVIRTRPHEMQPVQSSLQSAFETLPTAGLGILDRLPMELMWLTLHEFDILSLFRFRQVNRQARIISAGLREYNLVSRYGLEGLRGLLRARLASHFTIRDLYKPLITDKCSTCGEFGGHLFLPTVERCCFHCLLNLPFYRVFALSTFAKLVKMSPGRLDRLLGQKLRTVPGIYNMLEAPSRRPKHLIAMDKAIETLVAIKAIGQDAICRLIISREQGNKRFMAATAYPYYNLKDAKLERGVSCKGCQIRCQRRYGGFLLEEPFFTARGFLSHFSQCIEAQQHWTASEKGTRPVDEPPITRYCGYFSKLGPDGLPA
ncbi:hypothetical protein F5Y10DRAFT_290402 [Nemania abortiva]|nr:hypothetical protein F5Y10DRAFT_290402 [Nemania abortiva]